MPCGSRDRAQVIETQLGFDGVFVDRLNGDRSGPYRGGHPLYRPGPDVADRKDAGHARLHEQGRTRERPPLRRSAVSQEVRTGDYEAPFVAFYLSRQPGGVRLGADEDE